MQVVPKLSSLATAVALASLAAACAQTQASTQTGIPLTQYADADGYIDVQALTCAQLADTYQEDANALAMWYSGWYNGLAKKHYVNLPRTREGLHQVILYCKAKRDKKVIEGIAFVLKNEKK
jgi:hypothetical protein